MIIVEVSETIGIGSFDYRVVFMPKLVSDYKLLGQSLADCQLIKLEPDTTQQTKTITFWHEAIHGISDVYGCDLTEVNIDRIAQGVSSILRRDLGVEFGWSKIGGE